MSGPDFNGDGHPDLVVGVPNEDRRRTDTGVVQVLYGTAGGISAEGNQVWSQDSPGIPEEAERYDSFGTALGWGDFDGDGFDDLAVGTPRERTTHRYAGVVHILYGSAAGVTAGRSQLWDQDVAGVKGEAERDDSFGAALAAADFDGDGYDDLTIGVPGDSTPRRAGTVQVLRGGAEGLTSVGNTLWSQPTGQARTGDRFGSSLAVGDFDADGHPDLAIGATHRRSEGVERAGAVSVLYGTSGGLGLDRAQEWSQGSPGVPGNPESLDGFARSLATGDLDGDGNDDLAVAVPSDPVGTVEGGGGAANVLFGTSAGLDSARAQLWSEDSAGVPGKVEPGDFAAAIAVTDLDADGYAELVLGGMDELFRGESIAGRIIVLPGTDAGPVGAGSKRWTQDSPGVRDRAESFDGFGTALASEDFNSDGFNDLVIGAPGEQVGDSGVRSGAVNLLYGGPAGLSGDDDQFWRQGAAGVGERPEHGDAFGAVLTGSSVRMFF